MTNCFYKVNNVPSFLFDEHSSVPCMLTDFVVLVWQVYPNGSGASQGTHLSVFLEVSLEFFFENQS